MAGEPFFMGMPSIWGVQLRGRLPKWVSARTSSSRRSVVTASKAASGASSNTGHPVRGAERHGLPRHREHGRRARRDHDGVPVDEAVRSSCGPGTRAGLIELHADADATLRHRESIDLSPLEPLIAMPSAPVTSSPFERWQGARYFIRRRRLVGQPGLSRLRDRGEDRRGTARAPACLLRRQPDVATDPGEPREGRPPRIADSRRRTAPSGRVQRVLGMGQAPATDRISLRTVPRNFPGRSGTKEDKVCLVSPETAAASALMGVITDPRTLDMDYPMSPTPKPPS